MHKIGEHAVVLGASMGGLLAARVLADAYQRVTVVERDHLPDEAANRRGVPQGRHVHALLPGGADIIDELFPGIRDDLVARGAPLLSDYARLRFLPDGSHRLSPEMTLPPVLQPSRPFLETGLRNRVRELPNVRVVDGCDVIGVETDATATRVTGARICRRDRDTAETLGADLVVDATGRGARTPSWLTTLGYDRPEEDEVVVNIRYASRFVRLRPGAVPETLIVHGPSPERAHGFGLFAYENDTWLFTVQEFDTGDKHTPDYAWMLATIAQMAPEHVQQALEEAEPLSEVATHRFPANRRRRYDKLRRFPEGLLVFGDALCSFNPIYGQGMSVAAMEAIALRKCLRRGQRDLARRFFKAAARPIDVAWKLAVGADLSLPYIEGPRPLPVRLINAYVRRVLIAAEHDPVVAAQFMRVSAFLDEPPRLMRPSIVARVIAQNRRAHAAAVPAPIAAGVR